MGKIKLRPISLLASTVRDANEFKNSVGAPTELSFISKEIIANRSGEYFTTDFNDDDNVLYFQQGKTYELNLKKIVNNKTVGTSTTQFDISEITAGVTYRYTYDGTGTDPGITATTFPVGMSVVIDGANFTAANNGTFTVTASGTNYFEITNASGVAESNKTLGAGTLIPRSVPLEKHLTIKF